MSIVEEVGAEQESYCTFCLGDLYCGIEVSLVQEVIRHQPTTLVPLADGMIRGLMNLRGRIVTALDLRHCFELPAAEDADAQMNVVIRTDEGPVSLLVDRIGDVVQAEISSFEPPPETLSGTLKELIDGAYKLENELLLIINTENVIGASATLAA